MALFAYGINLNFGTTHTSPQFSRDTARENPESSDWRYSLMNWGHDPGK